MTTEITKWLRTLCCDCILAPINRNAESLTPCCTECRNKWTAADELDRLETLFRNGLDMTERNDGGPSFPHELAAAMDGDGSTLDAYLEIRSGTEIKSDIQALTKYRTPVAVELRDYFAAAALQGMLSSPQYMERAQEEASVVTDVANCFAKGAYQFADAMLTERERNPA